MQNIGIMIRKSHKDQIDGNDIKELFNQVSAKENQSCWVKWEKEQILGIWIK